MSDAPHVGGPAAPKTNTNAVTSLITGILSIVLCFFPLGIVGIITGLNGKRQIRESEGRETGEGLAKGGIITSIVGLVLVPIIAIVCIAAVTLLGKNASVRFSSVSGPIK